jgi:glyoxylase-like metal-dependent hydrolase (beta-lactamase superfamily II)
MRYLFLLLALIAPLLAHAYQPRAEAVTDNVYAIVGPLGQRDADNDGLNANYGFIVTATGVILIDSGASALGAEKLAQAIAAVTDRPVRWVINTGGQDHRWLGNAWFAERGAELIALARTAAGQAQRGAEQLANLERFLGARLAGTRPQPATTQPDPAPVTLTLGGETLILHYTDAHYPGDAMVWLPGHATVFSGDLVYVDRLLGVLPVSDVRAAQRAFQVLEGLAPQRIVPGHGRVTDLAQARRESGDYYDFIIAHIAPAARDMEPLDETLAKHTDLPAFRHLQNYDELHRGNMSRAFVRFESE